MVFREFIGWERPFLLEAADWLLAQGDELPSLLVVVPTTQSGRRLREHMAESSGALLSPRIVTPAWFLKTPDLDIAPDWVERLAWQETLEGIRDWTKFAELFPTPPDPDEASASGLGLEFTRLRKRLQENGHTLASASRPLAGSVERGRWEALSRLEYVMEKRLADWGFRSRSQVLAHGLAMPEDLQRIVLAGVTEMPPILEKQLLDWQGRVTVLVGAPEAFADDFSAIGRPLPAWSTRTQPWPDKEHGSVQLVADSRQEATVAFRSVCEAGLASDQVALGSADPETAGEIARVFSRGGWLAFDPAAKPSVTGFRRWLSAWSAWLDQPGLVQLQHLLTLPESEAFCGSHRETCAHTLARIRDRSMASTPDDLRRHVKRNPGRNDLEKSQLEILLKTLESFENQRSKFSTQHPDPALEHLIETIQSNDSFIDAIDEWRLEAAPLWERLRKDSSFALRLLLSSIPMEAATPPDGRVIDVQGWLELYFEPGRHLVLCGLNEGSLPAESIADPWLGESGARLLGLVTNADRAARDAFLFTAMIRARSGGGRVDLTCSKAGSGGETRLPSRFLLMAEAAELPARVEFLFREIEPPEAGMRWHADWQWQPAAQSIPHRLSATSLASWLACPFRFYLKHAAGMQTPEPDRVEWNHRDFGNVAHDVLEAWGRDEEAREFSKSEALEAWFSARLDQCVAQWFGKQAPLAIRIQTESLRQRLGWLARRQAVLRAEGWQVTEVEHKFEIPVGAWTIAAKIDRIDRHRESGAIRVIDYKTGKVDEVDRSHRVKITANTQLPAHLSLECPAAFQSISKGKTSDFRWTNLQLPLYVWAIKNRDHSIAEPCYFKLGSTEANVDLVRWADFGEAELEAARACTAWIIGRIEEGSFWPPAEKVKYDDFSILAAGRSLEEMVLPPGVGG